MHKTSSHPAIEQIRIQEETWQAIGFMEPNRATVEVGRIGGDDYYVRALRGTTNPAYIDDLLGKEPRPIPEGRALGLREAFDARWEQREDIANRLSGLLRAGFFENPTDDTLIGYAPVSTDTAPEQACTIKVEPDGAIRVAVDKPQYILHGKTVTWHEYHLPREEYYSEHEIHPEENPPEIRMVIDSRQIVGHVKGWFITAGRVAKGMPHRRSL